MQASHFNEAKLSHHYGIVRDAFETTIILDDNQISAYLGLATAFAFLDKQEEGLKFAQQGLAKVKELKAQDVPFHLSTVVPDGAQMLDEMEAALEALIREFS